ncbi:MAG: hypothetical protein MI723_10970, partial [Caulobacterales bacterium]|nr:hypothetical protein [Caulobacterales bacterium]
MFYEDVMADKAGGLREIYDYLELEDRAFLPPTLDNAVNATAQADMPGEIARALEAQLSPTARFVSQRMGRLPDRWLERFPALAGKRAA